MAFYLTILSWAVILILRSSEILTGDFVIPDGSGHAETSWFTVWQIPKVAFPLK